MTTKKAAPRRGKAVNCYFRDSDMERIRTLRTYLSVEGQRVTDSAVIAAALRVAKPDAKFLNAFEEGLLLDARRKTEE